MLLVVSLVGDFLDLSIGIWKSDFGLRPTRHLGSIWNTESRGRCSHVHIIPQVIKILRSAPPLSENLS